MDRSPKLYLQLLLRRLGIYHRLKASILYSVFWSIFDRSVVERAASELDFYREVLAGFRHGDLIFDIGANQGVMTEMFLRLGAKVIAVDPDETNRNILEAKFRRYRITEKPVVIVNQAVSDQNSVETMWIDELGSAKNTLNMKWVDTLRVDAKRFGHAFSFKNCREVNTTTLEQLFASYGVPFFIKIDVEGYEARVLRGLRRPVPLLSFEVNLPEFRSEGLECVATLEAVAPDGKFNYMSECRRGLMLQRWLGPQEFSRVLGGCQDASVDVFWKTNLAGKTSNPE